jgi:hypothetical protein
MMTVGSFSLTLFLAALALFPVTAAAQDSLRLRLVAPNEIRAGETLPLTLRAENTADRPLDLYLRGRSIAFDVIVTRADGAVVWRRLEGEIIPAIIQLRTLAPREVMELRADWNQRTSRGRQVGAGLYSVRGVLLTDGPTPLQTDAIALRIVPR